MTISILDQINKRIFKMTKKLPEKTKKAVKKKPLLKKTLPPIEFEAIYEKIKNFVKSHEKKYLLIASNKSENYFVMVHKKELTVKEVNNNNPFQPYEKIETKDFPLTFVIWFSYTREEPDFIGEMKKFNAKVLRLTPIDDFTSRIKNLFL
jgi:hypothetical protein